MLLIVCNSILSIELHVYSTYSNKKVVLELKVACRSIAQTQSFVEREGQRRRQSQCGLEHNYFYFPLISSNLCDLLKTREAGPVD